METSVKITEIEFNNLLTKNKGWVKNVSGYEYVYDYNLKNYPKVVIKVMSSISVNNGLSRNKGADAIRVFAVLLDDNGKVIRGLSKALRVYRTTNWRKNIKKAFINIQTKAIQNFLRNVRYS